MRAPLSIDLITFLWANVTITDTHSRAWKQFRKGIQPVDRHLALANIESFYEARGKIILHLYQSTDPADQLAFVFPLVDLGKY